MTMVEMIVSFAIFSITSSIAYESWKESMLQAHARDGINRLVMAVNETRRLALSQRVIVTLCPTPDNKECSKDWSQALIIFKEAPTNPDKHILRHFPAIRHGYTRWSAFRQTNYLQMQSNGLTNAQNGTFIYCPENNDPRHARVLIINKSARARLGEDKNGDGIVELSTGKNVECP
jgi:type IV fimbrial biogenesis protein FimT